MPLLYTAILPVSDARVDVGYCPGLFGLANSFYVVHCNEQGLMRISPCFFLMPSDRMLSQTFHCLTQFRLEYPRK